MICWHHGYSSIAGCGRWLHSHRCSSCWASLLLSSAWINFALWHWCGWSATLAAQSNCLFHRLHSPRRENAPALVIADPFRHASPLRGCWRKGSPSRGVHLQLIGSSRRIEAEWIESSPAEHCKHDVLHVQACTGAQRCPGIWKARSAAAREHTLPILLLKYETYGSPTF